MTYHHSERKTSQLLFQDKEQEPLKLW
jgi:hypothetical protein